MRWCVVVLVSLLFPVPLFAQEREDRVSSHDIAERWLHHPLFYEKDCTDPNYQVLVPLVFNPVVKLLLLGPNQIQKTLGNQALEFQFPEVLISALPDGCRVGYKEKEVKDELKDAALTFALQGTVGTVLQRIEDHFPPGLTVNVDIDPGDGKAEFQVEYEF